MSAKNDPPHHVKLEGICFLTLNCIKHLDLFIDSYDLQIYQEMFALYPMLGAGMEGGVRRGYKVQSKKHIIEY